MDHTGIQHIDIDGRDNYEESLWWSREAREKNKRPGPGMLPPLLAETLHHPFHPLYSVNFISFPLTPPVPEQSSSILSAATGSSFEVLPPSETETRNSVPHPNAYYCPADNGWVILSWRSSHTTPPLAQSLLDAAEYPLPDPKRRRTPSCISLFGKTLNMTHHFHKYEKAVDGGKLKPPVRENPWQSFEGEDNPEEGTLLDLYMCCQCSFYCVGSGTIPGVIPKHLIEELVRDRTENPPPGKTGAQAVADAIETIALATENLLWKGITRKIQANESVFKKKIGWNPNVKRIFELLEFVEADHGILMPPNLSTPLGKHTKQKLLRAWLELNAWIANYKRANSIHFIDRRGANAYVRLDSALEMFRIAIGAHPNQIPRGVLPDPVLHAVWPAVGSWHGLGLTLTSFSADLLAFAYLAQCRCDPARTPLHFSRLSEIVQQLDEHGRCPPVLHHLLAQERARYRFTFDDVRTAATFLGFGADNILGVEYGDDTPEGAVEGAWRDCVKRSWRDVQRGAQTQRLANDSFRVLAEMRGSAGANNE